MEKDKKTAIIIGAGPAGLTAAMEFLKSGEYHPIVLEELDRIGGISASVNYKGNRMDLGGHRFFSKSDEIMEWWTKIMPLGEEGETRDRVMLLRNRVSRIYYLRKFFDYPISLKAETFRNMGLARTTQAGFGYLAARIHKREEKSLEDFMINRFGGPLYHMFFEDYTEKVWGRHPRDISPEWGAQRIKGLSLLGVLKDAISKRRPGQGDWRQKDTETSLIESFLYPKYGPGHFWETVAGEILARGGEIRRNTRVDEVHLEGGGIHSVSVINATGERESLSGDVVLSSMPVKDLVLAVRGEAVPEQAYEAGAGLPYRDFITVGVLAKSLQLRDRKNPEGKLVPDCWIYIQESDVKIGRLQIFNNWSPYLLAEPGSHVWVGLEYFCDEGDDLWETPDDAFIRMAVDELAKLGILDPEEVLDAVRVRVKKAYPSYFGTYEQFPAIRGWLDTIPNLYCIGRNGQHRYNNMDHSMLTAMEAVRLVLAGDTDKASLWNINTEESYHEEKGN